MHGSAGCCIPLCYRRAAWPRLHLFNFALLPTFMAVLGGKSLIPNKTSCLRGRAKDDGAPFFFSACLQCKPRPARPAGCRAVPGTGNSQISLR